MTMKTRFWLPRLHEMINLRSVIFLAIKSSTLFTGGSNSGLSNIVKNKASKNHCRKPPPRHQTRNTEINFTYTVTISNFLTSFCRLSNLRKNGELRLEMQTADWVYFGHRKSYNNMRELKGESWWCNLMQFLPPSCSSPPLPSVQVVLRLHHGELRVLGPIDGVLRVLWRVHGVRTVHSPVPWLKSTHGVAQLRSSEGWWRYLQWSIEWENEERSGVE